MAVDYRGRDIPIAACSVSATGVVGSCHRGPHPSFVCTFFIANFLSHRHYPDWLAVFHLQKFASPFTKARQKVRY